MRISIAGQWIHNSSAIGKLRLHPQTSQNATSARVVYPGGVPKNGIFLVFVFCNPTAGKSFDSAVQG